MPEDLGKYFCHLVSEGTLRGKSCLGIKMKDLVRPGQLKEHLNILVEISGDTYLYESEFREVIMDKNINFGAIILPFIPLSHFYHLES